MISIPFWSLLIPYALLVVIFFVLLSFHLYHIQRFGFWNGMTIFLLSIFFLVTLLILGGTAVFLRSVDWFQTLDASIPTSFELPL